MDYLVDIFGHMNEASLFIQGTAVVIVDVVETLQDVSIIFPICMEEEIGGRQLCKSSITGESACKDGVKRVQVL